MKLKFFSPPMPYDAPPMLVLFMLCIGQANGGLKVNKGAFLLVGDKLSRFGGLSSFFWRFAWWGLSLSLGSCPPSSCFWGCPFFGVFCPVQCWTGFLFFVFYVFFVWYFVVSYNCLVLYVAVFSDVFSDFGVFVVFYFM